VGAFSGVENAKMWGSSPEMPKTGSPLAKGKLHRDTTSHEDRRAQRGVWERHQEDRREQRGDRSRPQGQRDPTKRAWV
jgi:hypothetical protein